MHILFDATRLLRRTHMPTPTGIDRVDLAYATAVLEQPHRAAFMLSDGPPRLLAGEGGRNVVRAAARRWSESQPADGDPAFAQALHWLRLPPAAAGGRIAASPRATHKQWRNLWLIAGRLRHAVPLPHRLAGSVYLNTSHSGFENTGPGALLQQRGAGIVAFLHDLIPFDHPQFSEPGAAARHSARLRSIQRHADLVLVNSRDTGDRFLRWLAARGLRAPPVERIPLGVDPWRDHPEKLARVPASQPYFVCAGTVEPRKNHALLLDVWQRLAEDNGIGMPRLVVAGRRNGDIAMLSARLARARGVLEVADLGDAALASLIAGAHGLLQPSFAEGFGLPVAEGQALGTPVVASDLPAHREIALPSTRLLDPRDIPAWLAAVKTLAAAPRQVFPQTTVFASRDHVAAALAAIAGHFGREQLQA